MSTAATVQSQGAPRLPVGAGEAVEAVEAAEAVEAVEAVPGEVRADTQEAGGGRAQRRGHTREHGDSQRRYNAVSRCAKKMKEKEDLTNIIQRYEFPFLHSSDYINPDDILTLIPEMLTLFI